MIPLVVVTGFLGSGKTTFLQRVVERHPQRRFVYLVNEFAPTDIDGQLLPVAANRLVSVIGGSIFCRCRVTEFIDRLRMILREHADAEGVLVEASGVADAKAVVPMLTETRLSREYTLLRNVTIIDPGSFGDLLETLPSLRSQVESADVALLNKVDCCGDDEVRATEAELRRIQPTLTILRTSHCRTDFDPFDSGAGTARRRVSAGGATCDALLAPCADPNYARLELVLEHEVNLARLLGELTALRETIYRAKGFVYAGGRRHYVDASRSGVSTRPAALPTRRRGAARERPSPEARPPEAELVFIYPPSAYDRVRELAERLQRGA